MLAIGQNIIWELFGILGAAVGSLLCGLAVLGVSGMSAAVISLVVTVKRYQADG